MSEAKKIPLGAFKQYDEVATFLIQFVPDSQLLRRKALVIDGPSWAGKTEFAKSLAPSGTMLDVNCSNSVDEPPLMEYQVSIHNGIVFDEMAAGVMVKQKKLFQAGAFMVAMGTSRTNCHSYNVLMWRKMMIVCSNKWMRQVNELCADDQAWIHRNTVYLQVTENMFFDIPGKKK